MTNPLQSLTSVTGAARTLSLSPGTKTALHAGGPSFESMLSGALMNTAGLEHAAQQALQTHLTGGDVTSVEVFAGMRKADLALRLMLQVRNKLLEGFREIKQMQM